MLRICSFFLLLTFFGGSFFASIDVELDVVFKDATVQCRYLYVLGYDGEEMVDTLAVFDSLSFNKDDRVSLFYSANYGVKNIVLTVDTAGVLKASEPFRVLSGICFNKINAPAVFSVVIGQEGQIYVANKNFFYLQKNNYSYFVFLFIFVSVKLLITVFFVLFSTLPKRTIAFASAVFMLTALIDWFLPMQYVYRLVMNILAEYLLIAIVGRKSISRLKAAMLVLFVNIAGFGIIAFLYLFYVFW